MKRHRKNPERLPSQHRWPNAFFADLGFWSLREAHFRFAQSPGETTDGRAVCRENRMHGSEGGGAEKPALPTPIVYLISLATLSQTALWVRRIRNCGSSGNEVPYFGASGTLNGSNPSISKVETSSVLRS